MARANAASLRRFFARRSDLQGWFEVEGQMNPERVYGSYPLQEL